MRQTKSSEATPEDKQAAGMFEKLFHAQDVLDPETAD